MPHCLTPAAIDLRAGRTSVNILTCAVIALEAESRTSERWIRARFLALGHLCG